MATHDIAILGWTMQPDLSGSVFFESYTVKATNDVFPRTVVIFNDTATKLSLHGAFRVPQNYVGTALAVVVWTSTVTSGNVVWDFDYRAIGGDDTESLDQATYQESVAVTDTAPGAANRKMEVTLALTSGNLAANDIVEFALSRDGSSGSDTLVGAVILIDAFFRYADV